MRQKAEEFEAVFLNVMLASAFEGLGEDDQFSSQASDTWRSMQVEQFASAISKSGGIGIADQIYSELLELQEQANQ
jgi:Rod binding domain-containing protein